VNDSPSGHELAIVEAGSAVPWTKPEDLPFLRDKPLPPLGGLFKDGFNVAFIDPSPKLKPPTHPDNEPHGRIEGAHAGQRPARSRIAAWAMGVGHDQTRKKRAWRAQRWAGSVRRNPLPFRAVR